MSRTILIPIHDLLVPEAAIESAVTGFPDAKLELVECQESRAKATDMCVIFDGGEGDFSDVPANASDAFLDLAHETAKAYGIDLHTATAIGSFGQATAAYAEANGVDMIVLGVDRERVEADREVREEINYLKSVAGVPYSIVGA